MVTHPCGHNSYIDKAIDQARKSFGVANPEECEHTGEHVCGKCDKPFEELLSTFINEQEGKSIQIAKTDYSIVATASEGSGVAIALVTEIESVQYRVTLTYDKSKDVWGYFYTTTLTPETYMSGEFSTLTTSSTLSFAENTFADSSVELERAKAMIEKIAIEIDAVLADKNQEFSMKNLGIDFAQ
jgi:hypothetical protein